MKPKIVKPETSDDIQVVGNIEQMYNKLVLSIDLYRSISSAPGIGSQTLGSREGDINEDIVQRNIVGRNIDPNKFLESRAHAFYRMVGFPSAYNGGYYNSGHDPDQSKTAQSRSSVNSNINKNEQITTICSNREIFSLDRKNIFLKQDDVSTLYAIAMSSPIPFLMAKTGLDPFVLDQQSTSIYQRKEDIDKFFKIPTNVSVPDFLFNPTKILKPFIVIPEIETTVTDESKRICVPFLQNIQKTKMKNDTPLKRPIIEYILRKRLQISNPDSTLENRAKNLLTNNNDGNLSDILSALSGSNNSEISESSINYIKGFTLLQTNTVMMFTKSIKYAVNELNKSIIEYNDLIKNQHIIPIPNIDGPESGVIIKKITDPNQGTCTIDKKIAQMELEMMIRSDQGLFLDNNIGDDSVFATAIIPDISKDLTPSIKNLQKQKDEYARKASNCLRNIEIITGEISGLGLVDILAIYTALWSIDIKYLLGFLDNNALSRINDYFPELVNNDVKNQINGNRPSITESLTEFETIFFNILTYSDKLLTQFRQSPLKMKKGSLI